MVGIAFRNVSRIYYFFPGGIENLERDDHVIVKTARGLEIGTVVYEPREVPDEELEGPLKPVLRRATPLDMMKREEFSAKEPEAYRICKEKIARAGLNMKLSQVKYNFDGSLLTVYFTAEKRVDFRALVRELSHALNTRILMRQIGVRDEAKMIGGIGRCGMPLCCSTWMREFSPVSIKLAKQQDLPLDPDSISGVCGKLLCCLAFEAPVYADIQKDLPRLNAKVMTTMGKGKVKRVHTLKRRLMVWLEDSEEMVEMDAEDIIKELPRR